MRDYISVDKFEDNVSVCFYIEDDKIMEIGDKLNEINENAYMNGDNWDALIRCYLEINAPDIAESMDSDPEAGMFAAYFSLENEDKANKLAEIIEKLIEDEDSLYEFVKNEGENIEWD